VRALNEIFSPTAPGRRLTRELEMMIILESENIEKDLFCMIRVT
jgi:hypothetical protein